MVDHAKRKVLFSLGGVMAVPFAPSLAFAENESTTSTPSLTDASTKPHLVSMPDADFTISLTLDGSPIMMVTNTTTQLKILRRVQPGVIQIAEKSYDLNHSLVGSAYAISAGATRHIPIAETSSSTSELILAARYKRLPLRAAPVTINDARSQNIELSKLFVA